MKKPNPVLERLLTFKEVADILAICERAGRLLRIRPIDLRTFQLQRMLS